MVPADIPQIPVDASDQVLKAFLGVVLVDYDQLHDKWTGLAKCVTDYSVHK